MDTRLFKFVTADEDRLRSLENNQVYFSSIDQLNDPFEFAANYSSKGVSDELRIITYAHTIKASRNVPISKARKLALQEQESMGIKSFRESIDDLIYERCQKDIEQLRSSHFVLSLSKAHPKDHDKVYPSPLTRMEMWGHYANGLKGICITYDRSKLAKSISQLNNRKIGSKDVKYQEELPVVYVKTLHDDVVNSTDNFLNQISDAFCTKFVSWRIENELRLISQQHGLHSHSEESILEVYVPARDKKLVHRVVSILNKKAHKPKLLLVELKKTRYGVDVYEYSY